MYKCKICGKKFTELSGLYNHIERKHAEIIPADMSVQQFYYYTKTGRTNGNCVMCKQPTTWNKNTNKYNRFCTNPKCKEEYVKIAKSRMIAKYGKVHLLNDPAKQREMLANRKISGSYRWSDSNVETTYTGSYELDFLKTLDGFFEWDPVDISMPSPHTYTYMYEGEQRFYIPDVFIHSLDCELEIKDGGDNPNNHYKIQAIDKEKERLKDEVMTSQKAFHYVKITNKNYTNFFDFLKEVKDGFEKYGDEKKIPRIFKIEDIKTKSTIKPLKESFDFEEGEEYVEEVISLAQANKLSHVYTITKMVAKLIDRGLKRSDKYNEVKANIKTILGDENLNNLAKLDRMISIATKVITRTATLKSILNVLSTVKNLTPEELREMAEMKKKVVKVINEKDVKVTDSFEFNEAEFNELYESFVSDLVSDLKSKPLKDNKFFIMQSYNVKKESPDEMTAYIKKLVKAIQSDDDMRFVKEIVGKSDTYFHNLVRRKPELQTQYNNFLKWAESELPDDIKKRMKKINESSVIYESSISLSRINLYLQKEYDKELKNYLDNYNTFYHRMLKERPDAVPNLNEDIRKAIIFIDGLAYKGVSNDLLKYARCELGDLVDLNKNTKEIKQSKYTQKLTEDVSVVNIAGSSEPTNMITLKLIYDPIARPRQSFMLNDTDSCVEINGKYILRRDQLGPHCSIVPGKASDYDRKVIEMQIRYFEPVDIDAKIKEKMEQGVRINSLYNPKDSENRFIKEVCTRLFDSHPETCTIIN